MRPLCGRNSKPGNLAVPLDLDGQGNQGMGKGPQGFC